MSFVYKIAMALAQELRERYPLDEIHVLPSFYYDISDKTVASPTNSNTAPIGMSLTAVRGKEALWSINIGDETLSITINKDKPEYQTFDKIAGTEGTELEGLSIGIIISQESVTTKFILAEPGCIEKVLTKIEEHYPIAERISEDQENANERGSQETL